MDPSHNRLGQRSFKPSGLGSIPRGSTIIKFRSVAQFGSASALGAEGRRFESCHSDHFKNVPYETKQRVGVSHPRVCWEDLRLKLTIDLVSSQSRGRCDRAAGKVYGNTIGTNKRKSDRVV